MRIPAIKPLHGWRQFLGEVGIIVAGVLIALAGQELVESRRWRGDVAEARASLDSQLLESKYASTERIALHACTAHQLDFLDEVIAGTRATNDLDINMGALRLWSTSAWDSATASGAVAHMPANVRNDYANLFAFTEAIRGMNQREFDIINELKTLEKHPQLTDVSRDRLARAVASARGSNDILRLGGTQWLANAKSLDLQFAPEDRTAVRELLFRPCVLPDGSRVSVKAASIPKD
ncbi:hypothetical protein H9L13_09845 [Sphingomonas lutea]|uniref:Uncharacterized protein n=1 Tax=Sphingomonas lutea TaxID=1045317 RepID=A0A7G9SGG8_9SPHN|nr:hypothetical protein [Sphingomonas lutea]QNN66943.1 hypothetical protein H9L13_09845 [Sphingomonas lutea]